MSDVKNAEFPIEDYKIPKSVIDFKALPLGQRLRRRGFRVIEDLDKELGCEDILNLFVKRLVAEEKAVGDEEFPKLKKYYEEKFGDYELKRLNDSIVEVKRVQKTFGVRVGVQIFRKFVSNVVYKSSYNCVPKITILENYIHDDIPIHIFEKVAEAKKEGLKDFFVAYPVIEKKIQKDPIVYSKLGDEMIFIGQWD